MIGCFTSRVQNGRAPIRDRDAMLAHADDTVAGRPGEVLGAFLRLGLTSFGGPVAHLGYFRREFVERRRWIDERGYAELVALCQFLPGPASSQVGFALGLTRAGPLGGMAAWAGFTLPSAALLVAFALLADRLAAVPGSGGLVHGLALVAVPVVAQAVWGMARSLCPDRTRASIAAAAAMMALLAPTTAAPVAAIAIGAGAGLLLCRESASRAPSPHRAPLTRGAGILLFITFGGVLILPALLAPVSGTAAMAAAFTRAGALVFGGGHVVLPLLRDGVVLPGWISPDAFLAGYGAAQAVPGPMFTFAAYLGARVLVGPGGVAGAAIALAAIFLPGLLLLAGVLPLWAALASRADVRAAMNGANAAVVGLLGAAFYTPVWTSGVAGAADVAMAIVGFVLLVAWRAPPLLVVALTTAAGVAGL